MLKLILFILALIALRVILSFLPTSKLQKIGDLIFKVAVILFVAFVVYNVFFKVNGSISAQSLK